MRVRTGVRQFIWYEVLLLGKAPTPKGALGVISSTLVIPGLRLVAPHNAIVFPVLPLSWHLHLTRYRLCQRIVSVHASACKGRHACVRRVIVSLSAAEAAEGSGRACS